MRLPSEIFGRLAKDRLLGLDLRLLSTECSDLGLEPGDLLRRRLRPTGRDTATVDRGGRRSTTEHLDPVGQRAPGDPQVVGDALQRGTRGGLVQIDGPPTELIGVVLPGHGRIFSLPPARMPDSSVSTIRGQGPSGEDNLAVMRGERSRLYAAGLG